MQRRSLHRQPTRRALYTTSLALAPFFALLACAGSSRSSTGTAAGLPEAPRADVRPTPLTAHGETRVDDYYWLRERTDADVIAYLEAENAYTDAALAGTVELQQELYDELVGRERQDDSTPPLKNGDYWYYSRFEPGASYPLHCRKRGSLDAAEEVLLDVPKMAEGHGYFGIGARQSSPDHSHLAYAVDRVGRRIYDIEVKDLATGAIVSRIPAVGESLVWAEDGRHVFYSRRDLETLRTHQIWRHEVGSDPARDALVYEEADETFSVSVSKTDSRRFLVITSNQTLANEIRIVEASAPLGRWTVVLPRERGHEYDVEHWGEHLYLRTNRDAPNFRLVRAPIGSPTAWEDVIPHRADILFESVNFFAEHMVVAERCEGLRRLRIREMASGREQELAFDDPAYAVWPGPNAEFDTTVLRFSYSSLTTPNSVYDQDMRTGERTLVKRDEVLGGFDPANYKSERLVAEARDGAQVPISLVYKDPLKRNGKRPLLLYAYGSYGSSTEPRFSPNVVSLLDRGWVYAIAHVRGGQELGRKWYEDGKLLKKRNTFYDFIDCAEHLVEQQYTSHQRLCAEGGSAGGLLMGVVVNERPDLFRAVIAAVPFVDVVTTMLDASIPLTTFEWDEWGDPRQKEYYDYMRSYSPYDQVRKQSYPDLLVTTGLHDSQVQYWEPAKWVAKLRTVKTDSNRLLLRCEMEAGHGGASGRYDRLRQRAMNYAFLISAVE